MVVRVKRKCRGVKSPRTVRQIQLGSGLALGRTLRLNQVHQSLAVFHVSAILFRVLGVAPWTRSTKVYVENYRPDIPLNR